MNGEVALTFTIRVSQTQRLLLPRSDTLGILPLDQMAFLIRRGAQAAR